MDGEEGVTQQRQGADKVGVTATGVVFAQARILAPMETDFDAGPVIADQGEPLRQRMGVIQAVADVEARFIEPKWSSWDHYETRERRETF